MSLQLRIDVKGDRAVSAGLARMAKRTDDLRPVFKSLTGKLRPQLGRNVPNDRGLMMSFRQRGHRAHVERIEKQEMELGSEHPLARLFQRSKERMRRHDSGRRTGILRRRELLVQERELDDVDDLVADHIVKGF